MKARTLIEGAARFGVTPSGYSSANSQLRAAQTNLENALSAAAGQPFNSQVKQAIKALQVQLQRTKATRALDNDAELKAMTKFAPKPARGRVVPAGVIRRLLRKVTLSGRWQAYPSETDTTELVKRFLEDYELIVDPATIQCHDFSLLYDDDDDPDVKVGVSMMTVVTFPGHIYVDIIGDEHTSTGDHLFTNLNDFGQFVASFD